MFRSANDKLGRVYRRLGICSFRHVILPYGVNTISFLYTDLLVVTRDAPLLAFNNWHINFGIGAADFECNLA